MPDSHHASSGLTLDTRLTRTGKAPSHAGGVPVNTPLVRSLSEEWRERKQRELPLGRFGEPEEVAATVAFLASPAASLFVGQTLGPNSGDVML